MAKSGTSVASLTDADIGKTFTLPAEKRPDIGEPITAVLMSIEYNPAADAKARTVQTADFKVTADGTICQLGRDESVAGA